MVDSFGLYSLITHGDWTLLKLDFLVNLQVCVLLVLISLLVWQGEGRARREVRLARGEEERRETRRKMLQIFDPRSKKTRREKKMKDIGSIVLVPVITKPSNQQRYSNQDIKERCQKHKHENPFCFRHPIFDFQDFLQNI